MRDMRNTRRKPSSPTDYRLTWEKMLDWVDEDIRSLTRAISAAIMNSQSDITGQCRGRYYCFYRGRPCRTSIFAALLLSKSSLGVRIKVDPFTFKDPRKLISEKIYRNWFFPHGQEREFRIQTKEQIDYAIKLTKQSYDLATFCAR